MSGFLELAMGMGLTVNGHGRAYWGDRNVLKLSLKW